MNKGIRTLLRIIIIVLFLPLISVTCCADSVKPIEISSHQREMLEIEKKLSYEEILAADTISSLYGADINKVLERKGSYQKWADLINIYRDDLDKALQDPKGKSTVKVSKPRYSQLTVTDLDILFQKGYGIKQISASNLIAKAFDRHIEEVLASSLMDKDWDFILSNFSDYDKKVAKKAPAAKGAEASTIPKPDWLNEVKSKIESDATEDDIVDISSWGLSKDDVIKADEIAVKHKRPLLKVAQLKTSRVSWDEVDLIICFTSSN